MKHLALSLGLSFAAVAAAGCTPQASPMGGPTDAAATPHVSWADLPPVLAPDPELAPLGARDARYARFCAAKRGDSFFKLMCDGARPNIPDLAALETLVGLAEDRAFALTGNSTSLVAMSVSALNPRMIMFPRVDATLRRPKDLIALGFVRGEQFVELVSRDSSTDELNFYLLSFEQSCNYQPEPGGCDLASLLTDDIEHGWTAFNIYSENELENTSFDCQACHQPKGFGTRKILRMQELSSPWLHWFPQRFVQRTDSDRVLLGQFIQAHDADKQYGGVPIHTISNALDEGSGAQLEALVRAEGFGEQPNAFDSRIATEALDGGTSPIWLNRFEAALRGDAIAVPYPRIDVTDEARRTAASKSYHDVVSGIAPRAGLIDTREVFSPDAMEKLGFVPQPGADGHAVLLQMCSRCHDGRANPDIGRGRFNVKNLEQMPRAEKDLAIARVQHPRETRMPPWRVGRMSPEGIQAAITELAK
jgi:hypothetical protein